MVIDICPAVNISTRRAIKLHIKDNVAIRKQFQLEASLNYAWQANTFRNYIWNRFKAKTNKSGNENESDSKKKHKNKFAEQSDRSDCIIVATYHGYHKKQKRNSGNHKTKAKLPRRWPLCVFQQEKIDLNHQPGMQGEWIDACILCL